jgi:hypothetical protein
MFSLNGVDLALDLEERLDVNVPVLLKVPVDEK